MKLTLPLLAAALVLTFSSSQAQDTATRKKQPPQPVPGRTAAPGENPIINKIAVNDPGMPPERPASTTKSAATQKPKEKKKRENSGVAPK